MAAKAEAVCAVQEKRRRGRPLGSRKAKQTKSEKDSDRSRSPTPERNSGSWDQAVLKGRT